MLLHSSLGDRVKPCVKIKKRKEKKNELGVLVPATQKVRWEDHLTREIKLQ